MKNVMKLVLATLLAFALTSPAMAYFEDMNLVQVAMSPDEEVAVDLGAFSSLDSAASNVELAAAGTLNLGQFSTIDNWANAKLAFFAQGGLDLVFATNNNVAPNPIALPTLSSTYAAAGTVAAEYAKAGTPVATITTGNLNSYTIRLKEDGSLNGFLTGDANSSATISLADLDTVGYVDMYLYHYNPQLGGFQGANGDDYFSVVRLMADGSTLLNSASSAAVPVPAAVWMLGSGLLGLVGIRRKK